MSQNPYNAKTVVGMVTQQKNAEVTLFVLSVHQQNMKPYGTKEPKNA